MVTKLGFSRRELIGWTATGVLGAFSPALAREANSAIGALFRSSSSTSTEAVNAWLAVPAAATIKRLTGTIKLTSPLIVPANTILDATGATITGPAKDNILKNAAAVPAFTTTANVTAASTTVVIASAVFTAAMVGQRVQVLGAGPRAGTPTAPGSMYGIITAVISPTQVTLDTPATTSLNNAKAFVYPPLDQNITIRGGTWINQNKNALAQTTQSHGFLLRRINGLTITNVTVKSTGTKQVGGQYAISIGDCTTVLANQLTFTNTASDGIHVQGPASGITIQNIVGTNTGDDLVAFTGVDGQSQKGSLLGDVEGDISNVLVSNIRGTNCRTHLKITSGTGANGIQRRITGFRATGISGTAANGAPVNIEDYAGKTSFSGTIQNVTATPSAYGPIIVTSTDSLTGLVIDGVTWPASMKSSPQGGIVSIKTSTADSITVKNVTNKSVAGRLTDLAGCGLHLSGATFGTLNVSGVSCPVAAPHFDSVQLGSPKTRIATVNISNDTSSAKTGNVLYVPKTSAGYVLGNVAFSNITRSTGSVLVADSDGAAANMNLSVTKMRGGKAIALLRTPATVTLSDVAQPAGGGAAVRLNSPAASPVRVVVTGSTRPPTLISRTGAQVVSALSPTIVVDTTLLTPREGDVVLGAVAKNGKPGLITYSAASATWKATS
jgi:hypothetical protein